MDLFLKKYDEIKRKSSINNLRCKKAKVEKKEEEGTHASVDPI